MVLLLLLSVRRNRMMGDMFQLLYRYTWTDIFSRNLEDYTLWRSLDQDILFGNLDFSKSECTSISGWKYWFLSLFKNEFNILHTIYFVVIMHIDFEILYQWFLVSETTFKNIQIVYSCSHSNSLYSPTHLFCSSSQTESGQHLKLG